MLKYYFLFLKCAFAIFINTAISSVLAFLLIAYNSIPENGGCHEVSFHALKITINGEESSIFSFDEFYVASIISILITILFISILYKFHPRQLLAKLKDLRPTHLLWVLAAVPIFYIGDYFDSETALLFNLQTITPAKILALGILGPILEELIFRRMLLQGIIESSKKTNLAVIISSVIFTLLHFQYDPMMLIFVFILSIFISISYLRTRNLLIPILFHILNNLMNFV